MPGRNINDQQVRTYMRLLIDHLQTTAAAKSLPPTMTLEHAYK